jgi:hypothetical protein
VSREFILNEIHRKCLLVVPHTLGGRRDLALSIKEVSTSIFADDCLIVTYEIPEGKGYLL